MEIIETIKRFFGQDDDTRNERLKLAVEERANKIYTIIKKDGKGLVLLNGKPASTDWDTDAENRLYRLREMYIEICIEKGEML